MEPLHPISQTRYSDRVNSIVGSVGDMVGKRVGGGRAQYGSATFEELAQMIISSETGFDKQSKSPWNERRSALVRIFQEYGWPMFSRAVLIAVVRKWAIDPKDGFIPLFPGSIDIEAGLNILEKLHTECVVSGVPGEVDQEFADAICEKVGLASEYGNGDSIEIVVPLYTPGHWQEVVDTEFGRPTGIIIVTPTLELYCEGMSVNNLGEVPWKRLSVKTKEAVNIAHQLCRECNIK
ncbi:MAG: hypothetical protein ACD_76C00123G0004 [uncultured bacterium]|nr:MAG: hypothetical protein ACD_76C00123G0004 [uncultured bacterium]HBD05156.1 hypothetical protein [Candidatus Uhrbacteria bacterium]